MIEQGFTAFQSLGLFENHSSSFSNQQKEEKESKRVKSLTGKDTPGKYNQTSNNDNKR